MTVLAVALVLSSWFVFQQGADLVKVLIAGFNGDDAGAEARQPASEPAPAQTNASPAPAEPSPTAAVTPATPTPIPQPTPAVPEDLVLQVTETPALADSSPGSAVTAAGAGNGFDLQKYLTDAGFPELAELPIEARLQDGKLILQGLVFMDVQRRDLLSLLSQTPGIQDVNAVDVLLRPKATYTVQDGDTLWSIVYDIQGHRAAGGVLRRQLDVVPQPGLLESATCRGPARRIAAGIPEKTEREHLTGDVPAFILLRLQPKSKRYARRTRFDVDVDILAHQPSAGLQGYVPRQTPVLTVNLAGLKSAAVAPGGGLSDTPSRTTGLLLANGRIAVICRRIARALDPAAPNMTGDPPRSGKSSERR